MRLIRRLLPNASQALVALGQRNSPEAVHCFFCRPLRRMEVQPTLETASTACLRGDTTPWFTKIVAVAEGRKERRS